MVAIAATAMLVPARARADHDVQVASDLLAGGGVRIVPGGAVTPYASLALRIDALIGSPDPRWNAPRFGPWASVRRDVAPTYSNASVAFGMSALLTGLRDAAPFRSSALLLSVGGGYGAETDTATNATRGQFVALLHLFWGFRFASTYASATAGLFLEYRWILAPPLAAQHDIVVGIEFNPLLLSAWPLRHARRSPSP